MRITLLILAGCGAASDMAPAQKSEAPRAEEEMWMDGSGPGGGGMAEGRMGASAPMSPAPARSMLKESQPMQPELADKDQGEGGRDEPSASTRSWFPETFLWEPALVTDASGVATISFTVPDSLTTWRVLALAASREGNQAGDLHTFSSTLPVYVDPLVPPFLRLGDVVQLPIQVVNTTSDSVRARLNLSAAGLDGAAGGVVEVGPYGSVVETARLTATQPGPASVRAALGSADAVQRELVVVPTGRKLTQARSGLLGAGASVAFATPVDAQAAQLRLTLYPGPVGVVRAELSAATAYGSTLDRLAYAFTLGSTGAGLLESLGASAQAEQLDALRETRLLAQQGLVRAARAPGTAEATLILAAVKHGDDPVSERLTARLREQVLSAQLPDGSWEVPDGSPLQRLLATTAWTAAVVDDAGARVRANAIIERYADRMLDPSTGDAYTAALVLKAGLGAAETRKALAELVRGAIGMNGTGASRVTLPEGVQRPDGRTPSAAEVEALVAQVLEGDAALDMAATLMGRYRPGLGFGDGHAGLAALDALARLGKQEVPASMDVVLKVDGQEVARHTLRAAALGETAVLSVAAPRAGEHTYEVVSEGAWPGLAWSLELDSWVPWEKETGTPGLELAVSHGPLGLGLPVDVRLQVSGPEHRSMLVTHELPVGFRPDPESVIGGSVVRIDDERVVLRVDSGVGLAEVQYTAVPTLGGSLWSGAATVALEDSPDAVSVAAPSRWVVP